MAATPRAVVLLSGGLDSTTCLAIARADGFTVTTLAVDYGQRHRIELQRAAELSRALGAEDHREVRIDLRAVGGSALTDSIDVPKDRSETELTSSIPVTYVPARNAVFLSVAMGLAEVVGARDLYIGVNAVDYSGYPDCRPEFIEAFEAMAALATRDGIEGRTLRIRTPLSGLSKAEIVREGVRLGVDYALTHSCYDPDEAGLACGRCDSCALRRRGFEAAGIPDPTRYAPRR